MKVCTDACIFGAYVARHINKLQLPANNILDIGAGTGLLSLMLSQKTTGTIDAVEIDEAASQQAKLNFAQSPWMERLHIYHEDALQFYPEKKYDCIISNPPFFEGDLKSRNKKLNAAKHDSTLTLDQLLVLSHNHLSPHGFLAILLPCHRMDFFIEIAIAVNYFLNEQLLIQHTKTHPFFRGILFFSHHEKPFATNKLAIKNETGTYTPEFIELLEEYYL